MFGEEWIFSTIEFLILVSSSQTDTVNETDILMPTHRTRFNKKNKRLFDGFGYLIIANQACY